MSVQRHSTPSVTRHPVPPSAETEGSRGRRADPVPAAPAPGDRTAGRSTRLLPRLGRAITASVTGTPVSGVILVLPTGEAVSDRRTSLTAYRAALPLARSLARAGASEGLIVHIVRYRRGWNGLDAQLAADTNWAAEEVIRRYGDVTVCLAGHGMGGRAALHAAGHPAVNSVLVMSPWLPEDNMSAQPEPVKQLVGRQVLIVHGTNDAHTDPELSYRLAERAKKVNRDTCRFEVHSDGHALRQHHHEVLALASDFVLGALLSRTYSRPIADALAAPPPLGLRMPLAAGFRRSLRR